MGYSIDIEKFRTIRLNLGLSKEELAKKANVTYLSVYRIETEKTICPQIRTVKKLCDALGVTVDQVLK